MGREIHHILGRIHSGWILTLHGSNTDLMGFVKMGSCLPKEMYCSLGEVLVLTVE